ncbi:MAG: RNA methyltransferase [Lachnospiraceae bacterium]|jgi:TrmH family RNA methyltransferase|nr:RNA methyltransferase [Lachnospiraceae bacterium]
MPLDKDRPCVTSVPLNKDRPCVTSAANPGIRRVRALQTKGRTRREEQAFVTEGLRLYLDAPAGALEQVYVSKTFLDTAQQAFADRAAVYGRLTRRLEETGCTVVSDDVFAGMSDTETPQGVLCVARMPVYGEKDLLPGDGAAPLLLLLEDIQDPGNLGTIFRTAEAAGVTGIVMTRGTVDLFNPKTVRATMGSVFRMPFLQTEDLPALAGRLRSSGISVFAAHLAGSTDYDAADYTKGAAFLIGNEGNGLSEKAAAAADTLLRIPMRGQIESLNAAMAAGILVYEAYRQRRFSG